MAIGVMLKSVEAYAAFLNFRKEWYVPTKFILDPRDIDLSLELIVTDTPLDVANIKVLLYGTDICGFERLAEFVSVMPALLLKPVCIIDTDVIRAALPKVEVTEEFYSTLAKDFSDILYDSRDMEGLDFDTTGLNASEIEQLKSQKIGAILAQRTAERLQEEENARLERERIEREEAERKAAEEEAERLKRQNELKAAREQAEREAAEAKNQQELDDIRRQAEIERQKLELANKEAEVAAQLDAMKIQEQQRLLDARQQAISSGQIALGALNSTTVEALLNQRLTAPTVTGFNYPKPQGMGLKIGRRSTKKSTIYAIAGAQKNCGSSTFAYNFAYTLAKSNPNTLLIDLDFIDNDLSVWFKADKLYDCCIDVPFRGIDFNQYLKDIDSSVVKVSLGKRRLTFIGCSTMTRYTPESRTVLREYNFMELFKALSTRFDNIVVDIGCLSQPDAYQKLLLTNPECKSIVCYGAASTADINESIHNVYSVAGYYSAVLMKAPRNINRIVIEKAIQRQIFGIIPNSTNYHAGSLGLYEEDAELKQNWDDITRIGGVLV